MSKETEQDLIQARIADLISKKKREYNDKYDPHSYGKRKPEAINKTTNELFDRLSREVITGIAGILDIAVTTKQVDDIVAQLQSPADWANIQQMLQNLPKSFRKS